MIDLNILEKGDKYRDLKRSFVMLDFVDGKEPEDDFTRELDEAVQSVRKNEKSSSGKAVDSLPVLW